MLCQVHASAQKRGHAGRVERMRQKESVFGEGQSMYLNKDGSMISSTGAEYRHNGESGWQSWGGGGGIEG